MSGDGIAFFETGLVPSKALHENFLLLYGVKSRTGPVLRQKIKYITVNLNDSHTSNISNITTANSLSLLPISWADLGVA